MGTFVNMEDEDADNDLAVYEKAAKITLGDKVEKPVEVPSWSKPVARISDDDAHRLNFYNRQARRRGPKSGTSITTAPVTRATPAPARSRKPATSSHSITSPSVTTTGATASIVSAAS